MTDDTAAIHAAIAQSGLNDLGNSSGHDQIIYFPAGIYLISNTLEKRYSDGSYADEFKLMGASRCGSIIRLTNNASGFGSSATTRPVIRTASKSDPNNHQDIYAAYGGGADAYFNFVHHLTIDTGSGNPGAIGIDYLANNVGSIRDVTVTAPSGSGAIGINMTRHNPGPCLVKDTTVQGFSIGIDVDYTEYSVTLDNVSLQNQTQVALQNTANMVSAHNLQISGSGLALKNVGASGLITIQSGKFTATGGSGDLSSNEGYVAMMDIQLSGGRKLQNSSGPAVEGVFSGMQRMGNFAPYFSLQARETPTVPDIPFSKWANVVTFGAQPDLTRYVDAAYPASSARYDSTAAIQSALNSGAEVVYFPHGTYYFSNLTVPEGVRRIVGFGAVLRPMVSRQNYQGMFIFRNSTTPVAIDHFMMQNANQGRQISLEVRGAGTVTIRDFRSVGASLLLRKATGGEVFLEDTSGQVQVAGPAAIYARQLNIEYGFGDVDAPDPNTAERFNIINKGVPLWILGMKAEQPYMALDNQAGSITNIIGGLYYKVQDDPTVTNLFKNEDGIFSSSFLEESLNTIHFDTYLENTLNGVQTIVPATDFPSRASPNKGRVVPVISSLGTGL